MARSRGWLSARDLATCSLAGWWVSSWVVHSTASCAVDCWDLPRPLGWAEAAMGEKKPWDGLRPPPSIQGSDVVRLVRFRSLEDAKIWPARSGKLPGPVDRERGKVEH